MRQRIKTTLQVDEDGSLICACFNDQAKSWDSQHLYSVKLSKLNGNEMDLQGGRFGSFSFHPQAHSVVIPAKNLGIPWQTTDPIIEWISDHEFATWSIRGIPVDVSNFALEFSFATPTDATLFALRWR